MTLIDISVPIRPDMPIYDGNPGVRLERVLAIDRGDSANVSRLELGVHTGTHVDAPVHFLGDGAGGVDALERCGIPADAERVLLKTPNGALWDGPFTREFIRLDGSGASWLLEPGWYDVACLPLDLVGADGAPARAVLAPHRPT